MNNTPVEDGAMLVAMHQGAQMALQACLDEHYPRGARIVFEDAGTTIPVVKRMGVIQRSFINHDGTVGVRVAVLGVIHGGVFTLNPLTHALGRL